MSKRTSRLVVLVGAMAVVIAPTSSAVQEEGPGALVLPGPSAPDGEIQEYQDALASSAASSDLMATGGSTLTGENKSFDVIITEEQGVYRTSVTQTGPVEGDSEYVHLSDGRTLDLSEIIPHAEGSSSHPQRVSGCRALSDQNGWIRRADCYVYDSFPLIPFVSGWFYADYSVKTGYGRVDTVYGKGAQCFGGGGVTDHALYIARKLSSGTVPARAVHSWRCEVLGVSGPARHDLLVRTSAWSEVIE